MILPGVQHFTILFSFMFLFLVCMMFAYLVGSISTAVLVSKILKLQDPRCSGSKNPGATNVLRLSGKKAGIYTLLGDVAKGLLPVLVAKLLGLSGLSLAFVGLAAFLGHLFPVFFGFVGGKGVATALGVLLGLSPVIALLALVGFAVVFAAYRYVSLASLSGMLIALLLTLLIQVNYFLPIAIMAALVVWRHWPNIERLKAGTENKTKF